MIKTLFRQWGASLCLGFLALASQAPAAAQDLPGAKDHPAVKRFGGSTIVGYEVRNFDAVEFQTSTFKEFDLQAHKRRYVQPPLALEGKLTRLWYEAPGATRSLELFRNYANDLAASGFTALYDSTRDSAAGSYTNFLANFSSGQRDNIKNNRRNPSSKKTLPSRPPAAETHAFSAAFATRRVSWRA